jgi:hypothetical protein
VGPLLLWPPGKHAAGDWEYSRRFIQRADTTDKGEWRGACGPKSGWTAPGGPETWDCLRYTCEIVAQRGPRIVRFFANRRRARDLPIASIMARVSSNAQLSFLFLVVTALNTKLCRAEAKAADASSSRYPTGSESANMPAEQGPDNDAANRWTPAAREEFLSQYGLSRTRGDRVTQESPHRQRS